MFEVVIDGSFIVLEKCVGVAQAVTGLGLHCFVLQKPGQLQGPPEGETQEEEGQGASWAGSGGLIVICALLLCLCCAIFHFAKGPKHNLL